MYYFIVNVRASSGKGRKVWQQVEPELRKRQVSYEAILTTHKGHARKVTRELTSRGEACKIVVLGGDGTLNEVVNGIVDFSCVTLGYIPAGSGNDFARGMKIPQNPIAALERVLIPSRVMEMDVAVLTRNHKKWRFAVSCGKGFDAAVCHQTMVSRLKPFLNKIKMGKLVYVMVALQRLYADQPKRVTMIRDGGEPEIFDHTYFVAVMNVPFEGGGFEFCPKADCTDGLLDIIVASDISKWQVLLLLPQALKGKHVGKKGVNIYQCKKVEFLSESPLPLHTDGEPLFMRKHISMEVHDERMKIMV